MGERLGVIAGSGPFARQAIGLARERGYVPVVAGIRGEASGDLERTSESFAWIGLTDLEKLVAFFRNAGVREVVFVGKVDPAVLAGGDRADAALAAFLATVRDATPTAVLESLISVLSGRGFAVKDPTFLLQPYFRAAGLLGRIPPPPGAAADIAFGWPLVRALADLEIGQTIRSCAPAASPAPGAPS